MTTHIKICPICGTEVETKVESAPDWYHNDSGILLRIYCNEICRDYLIAATLDKNGKVWVEKSTQTLLNLLDDGRRGFFSRAVRGLRDNNCWLIVDYPEIHSQLTDRRFAIRAATQFGLKHVKIEHTGAGFDTKNRIFFVFAGQHQQQRFTLRVHDVDADFNGIHSTLFWQMSLSQKANLLVPEPLSDSNDAFILPVSVPGRSEQRYCTLYRYVDGKDAQAIGNLTPAMVANFGEFVAKMHQHAAAFQPPTWFTRPYHPREIKGIPKTPENYGIIHREIENSANVLFQGERAGAIDFQECWRGYYVVEIAGLLESQESFVANHQAAFLEGYQRIRQLPENFEEIRKMLRK